MLERLNLKSNNAQFIQTYFELEMMTVVHESVRNQLLLRLVDNQIRSTKSDNDNIAKEPGYHSGFFVITE